MLAELAPPEAGGDPFLAFSSFKGSAFLSKVAGGKRCPRHKDPVRVSGECRETLTPARGQAKSWTVYAAEGTPQGEWEGGSEQRPWPLWLCRWLEREALPGHSHSPSVACCLATCLRQWSDGPRGTISPELCTVWLAMCPFLLTSYQISTRNNVCSPSSCLIGSLPVPATPASPTNLVVPD